MRVVMPILTLSDEAVDDRGHIVAVVDLSKGDLFEFQRLSKTVKENRLIKVCRLDNRPKYLISDNSEGWIPWKVTMTHVELVVSSDCYYWKGEYRSGVDKFTRWETVSHIISYAIENFE